jgi:hypothetical protein
MAITVDANTLLRIVFAGTGRELGPNAGYLIIDPSRHWLKQYTSFGPWRWQMMFLLLGAGCPAMQAL